jgi:hypothetical protein
LNRDFAEMLSALFAEKAEFIVVGAHAMAAHGFPRATGDLDVWVRPTKENADRVWRALAAFGAPLGDLRSSDLVAGDLIFQIGVVPCRIDVITQIDGVEFASAWERRGIIDIGGTPVPVLSLQDLITNKRATGRPKDLADVVWLESGRAP